MGACATTLLTPTRNAVLDRKGVGSIKFPSRLVSVAVHVVHNLVRQLSKHLVVMMVMMLLGLVMVGM